MIARAGFGVARIACVFHVGRLRAATIACALLCACHSDTLPARSQKDLSVGVPAAKQAPLTKEGQERLIERARELAQRFIIVDGHIDVPYRLHESKDSAGKLTEDISTRTREGDFDYPRAIEGGLDAPFMSIYIPAEHQKTGGAKALADGLIDMVQGFAEKSPDKFAMARSVSEVVANAAAHKISLLLGIENGAAIEGNIDNVAHFHRRGVRYITLTHSKDNDICDSSYDKSHTHKGLSEFGAKVVKEMNRLGIMIDVSHISDDAFAQVLALSKTPVIASHSSCRHFTPGWERNLSDEMIRTLAGRGGVMMVNFGSGFIDDKANKTGEGLWKALDAFLEEHKIKSNDPLAKQFIKDYAKTHDLPFATVEQVADHIDHVVRLVGIDHVGLGSDFDGVGDSLPVGLKDVSAYPNLFRVLLERGYRESDVEKICSGNLFRVWKEVEKLSEAPRPADR